jgi:hypothetical protein
MTPILKSAAKVSGIQDINPSVTRAEAAKARRARFNLNNIDTAPF